MTLMQIPLYTVFLFTAAFLIIYFLVLKKWIGFKKEIMARYHLYQVVAGLLTVAFITAAPLNVISPTLQYIATLLLLILSGISFYILERRKNLF